jgi:hypothetical protein
MAMSAFKCVVGEATVEGIVFFLAQGNLARRAIRRSILLGVFCGLLFAGEDTLKYLYLDGFDIPAVVCYGWGAPIPLKKQQSCIGRWAQLGHTGLSFFVYLFILLSSSLHKYCSKCCWKRPRPAIIPFVVVLLIGRILDLGSTLHSCFDVASVFYWSLVYPPVIYVVFSLDSE